MSPEERETQTIAAAESMPAWTNRYDLDAQSRYELATLAIDAAYKAVPVVSQTEHERTEAATRGFSEALAFYADPDTYFAWAFLGDPPCGEWDTDFEDVPNYGSAKPGKRARDVLAAHPNFARDADA